MVHDPVLLDALERFDGRPWTGVVQRHVLGSYPPDRANVRGARWNPPEVSALYVSLDRATAEAEGTRILEVQSVAPRVNRSIYELEVKLGSVIALSEVADLAAIGLSEDDLRNDDFEACQRVGGAVAWIGHDGLFVPSARLDGGRNLVIFTANMGPESDLQIQGHISI